jgi:dihydropyrimidinase
MTYDLIVTNGLLVDGDRYDHDSLEIGIKDGKIAAVASRIDGDGPRHDAGGQVVMPGLIDPHVHLSLPMKGTISSDTVATGTAAALLGGVTTVLDFTLQKPGQSLAESLQERQAEFAGYAYTDYAFHVCVTDFPDDWFDQFPAALQAIREMGGQTLKVFTCYSREGIAISERHLRRLLWCAKEQQMLTLVHAEHDSRHILEETELLDSGKRAVHYFPLSRPPNAELMAIADSITAANATGAAIYFVHVSTANGAEAINNSRRESKSPIYMETCPQYFALDDHVYEQTDGIMYLVAPPLRPSSDRAAIAAAVVDGVVDIIATDHCPFTREQKDLPELPFNEIPNGLPGVETRLALTNTLFVSTGALTLCDLVRLCGVNPARIHGLYPRKGTLAIGADADLVFFSPQREWVISADGLHMNTDFSPYEGMAVTGGVEDVLLGGVFAVKNGELVNKKRGSYLPR